MSTATYVEEVATVQQTVQHYIDGARTGKGAAMKPAFQEGATILGYMSAYLTFMAMAIRLPRKRVLVVQSSC